MTFSSGKSSATLAALGASALLGVEPWGVAGLVIRCKPSSVDSFAIGEKRRICRELDHPPLSSNYIMDPHHVSKPVATSVRNPDYYKYDMHASAPGLTNPQESAIRAAAAAPKLTSSSGPSSNMKPFQPLTDCWNFFNKKTENMDMGLFKLILWILCIPCVIIYFIYASLKKLFEMLNEGAESEQNGRC